ncbi:MAG: TerD family protein [Mycobacteriaceae bacterium]
MAIDYTKRKPAAAPVSPGNVSPGNVSLSKVTLTKDSPSISLSKPSGRLRVNLNWDARPPEAKQGGFLKRLAAGRGIDLDLGCLYELADGRKGVVQALGNAYGNLDRAPYILLNGDDRSGANSGGEDLFVNLAHTADIRRVLVFACIYDGAPSFDQAKGVVTLTPATGAPIEVLLDEQAGGSQMCAVALLENVGGELTVRREVRYVEGAQDALDREYGWGMDWARGRK